jgi:hypothetical protein
MPLSRANSWVIRLVIWHWASCIKNSWVVTYHVHQVSFLEYKRIAHHYIKIKNLGFYIDASRSGVLGGAKDFTLSLSPPSGLRYKSITRARDNVALPPRRQSTGPRCAWCAWVFAAPWMRLGESISRSCPSTAPSHWCEEGVRSLLLVACPARSPCTPPREEAVLSWRPTRQASVLSDVHQVSFRRSMPVGSRFLVTHYIVWYGSRFLASYSFVLEWNFYMASHSFVLEWNFCIQ